MTTDEAGCEACRRWLNEVGSGELETTDCKSSFEPINSYFSARLQRCPRCATVWLEGYHEDFTDVDIAAEWGLRTWIYRPLTQEDVVRIEMARGSVSLDIETFGA